MLSSRQQVFEVEVCQFGAGGNTDLRFAATGALIMGRTMFDVGIEPSGENRRPPLVTRC